MNECVVIGDVHGCYKTLMALIKKLPDCKKFFVGGPIIDRGPNSKDVVQFIIDHQDEYSSVLGNHEYMMKVSTTFSGSVQWLNTLKSYGGKIDPEHFEFLSSLPVYLEEGDLFISHSSYNSRMPFSNVIEMLPYENSIIWNRTPPCKFQGEMGDKIKFHIFGHTPQINEPKITDFYANIDTGCFYKTYEGLGKLTAIHYPSLKIFKQENID